VLLAAVPPADLPLAQAAERACPARAITLSSDDVTGA
jgi:ferredoxin